jgi:uncharacterized protein (UPF0248 family)
MIPIQDLLNRIHWDQEFGKGSFRIGYYDRVKDCVIQIPLREIWFEDKDHFSFQLLDDEGETHMIPLHRVREVYRDGQLIWQRET